jgi:SPP1 family predicted phage head-tail adaptor
MPVKNPEIEAGTLDKRVTLLRPIYSTEYQDEIADWEPVAEVWAGITPNFGQEATHEGARVVATKLLPVIIRYRSDIDARWRIRDSEHEYGIDSILDLGRRRAQLQIACKEIA